jgi:hypothetical protein
MIAVGLVVWLSACTSSPPSSPASSALPPAGTLPVPLTPTPAPPTSVPTLPAPPPDSLTTDQLNQRLNPFASADCTLPCYNGITPGQSGLPEATQFYARLGIGLSDIVPGDYQTVLGGTGNLRATLMRSSDVVQALQGGLIPPEANIFLANGVVQIVYVRWSTYPAYLAAPAVLSALGPPDQVSLALMFGADPNVPSRFVVEMVYVGKQSGLIFVGNTDGDAASRQVCLSDQAVKQTVLGVFAPGLTPLADNPAKAKVLPLEGSTGVSITSFATMISAGGCLQIAADRWNQWRP